MIFNVRAAENNAGFPTPLDLYLHRQFKNMFNNSRYLGLCMVHGSGGIFRA